MGRLLAVVIAVAVAQGSLRVQGLDGSAVDPLAMPKDVKIPAAIAEEMCGVLLDRIKDGGGVPDAASARFLPVLLRQLGAHPGLVERARALGVLVDGT